MSLIATVGLIPCSVLGAGAAAAAEDQVPRREVFGGVETASNYATVYAGGGYAFGGGFYEPGWRIRAVGAWGAYDYNRMLFDGSAYSDTTFNGQVAFLSAQVGYQFHQGRTIVAGFIGMEAVDQAVSPFDPGNAIQGTELGLRLTLETWTDISDLWFLSADGGYGTAFQEYWQLSRIGYRLGSVFAVGAEGGILGNQEYDAGRVGGFIRGTFNAVEATVSAGFSGEYLLGDPGGYASVNLYRKF